MKVTFYTYLIFIAFLLNTSVLQAQKKISGITVPQTLTVDKVPLTLNGAGIRTKYFMDMYVGALYLQKSNKEANRILAANEPMAIRLHIVSGLINSKKIEEALNEGFEKSTNGNTAIYKEKIEAFNAPFKEELKQNDIFDIVYSNETITILKNNQPKANIKGHDFKKVVFGIWLSDKPADENLKKGMLGG